MGCRACGSPGGGCQFLGNRSHFPSRRGGFGNDRSTRRISTKRFNRFGWRWHERALGPLWNLHEKKLTLGDILTQQSFENALAVHAAVGGSTNLLLHVPAVAFAAGLPRPTIEDWTRVNRLVSRFVDVLPNGPSYHPTVRLFHGRRSTRGHVALAGNECHPLGCHDHFGVNLE